MTEARIYQPAKNAMQSGRANMRQWILEYAPAESKRADPLMGWIGSGDTRSQIKVKFETLDAATAYAEKHSMIYTVAQPHTRKRQPKNYAANFAYDRVERAFG